MPQANTPEEVPEGFMPKTTKVKPVQNPVVASKVAEGPMLDLQKPTSTDAGPWVQYDGIATLRIIDAEAWHNAGVNSDKYVEWNSLNGMRVPVSHFTDAELAYLLGRDGRFSKVQ